MKNQWIGYTACLLLGVPLGFVLDPDGPAGDTAAGDQVDGPPSRLSASDRRQRMASDWVDRGVDVNSDDEMISLPGELLRQISNYPGVQSPRDSLFREDDPVEGLLGISPHEKEQLQEAWQASRKKIEALEVRSLRTEQLDDGSVKLEVPDLAQSLSAMAMDFELAIEQALGESRARTFSVLKRLDETFSLQAGVRHYHLRVESVGNGSWRYHIESSDQQGSRVWVGDSVPQKIRHLTDAAQIVPSIRAADSGESE